MYESGPQVHNITNRSKFHNKIQEIKSHKMITTTTTGSHDRRCSSWIILLIGSVCCCLLQVQQASAILNCFTPKNMFNKLGKGGYQVPYAGGGGPERANWYPQSYPQQQQAFNPYAMYQYPSMKSLLFQPKWKGGSLLGNKNWPPSWKSMGAGSTGGFYRPGFGYGYSTGGGSMFGSMAYPQAGSYGHHQHHPHSSDMIVSYPGTPASGYSPVLNTYTAGGAHSNDGWTIPSQHQINQAPISYDTGYVQPITRQPTIDPYGSVKGGSSRISSSTTKKGNILIADGGYNAFDAHLGADPFLLRNRTFGYSYPESYSGVVESPAKIAQQLMRYGLRQQRLQQQSQLARLAPLLLSNGSLSNSRLALIEEPKFVGFGVTDVLNNREARLSCSFNEPIDQTSQPTWIKFLGQYNSTQMSGANIVPPYNCPSIQCRTQEIDPLRDVRYRLDNGPATSTLIISEPRTSDYGVYRCSAVSSSSSSSKPTPTSGNIQPLSTIYKIVQLGDSV